MHLVLCCALTLLFLTGCDSPRLSGKNPAQERADVLRGCFGTYGAAPRRADGHVDIPRLLAELEDIHANTYHWVQRSVHDLEDLKEFLPQAQKKQLKVWVTLLPPSEPPPSEPFRLDFIRWAQELAKLSLEHRNLVAWSIDDFPYNLKLFTPEYVAQMTGEAHRINPRLAFVPCCYFKQLNPTFVARYKASFDGVLFPYRAESAGGNLKDPTLIESEMKILRERFGPDFPIVLDVYASAHSRLGATTPEYVEELMARGKKVCDGVLIYKHQDPQRNADKYEILKRLFSEWGQGSSRTARKGKG